MFYKRPCEHPVNASSAYHNGGKKTNSHAHIRLDNRLVRLREHEVRDQDIKKRLHFNQREALTNAGLVSNAFVRESICAKWQKKSYAGSSGECQRVSVETWERFDRLWKVVPPIWAEQQRVVNMEHSLRDK